MTASTIPAAAGRWRFPSGERERTITVPVLDDNDDEGDETFTMSLSSAVNATLDDREGRATITDNDGTLQPPPSLPELNIGDVTVAEDGGGAAFRVTLSKQSSATVTVGYATADGTADDGLDYSGSSGTLAFPSGERERTITVPVLDDNDDEGDETFTVSLSSAVNAMLDDREGRATITDNDGTPQPPPSLPELNIGDVTVAEDGGGAAFRVTLSKQSSATVTVGYATADGTADDGLDYSGSSGTLAFPSGERERTITVPVLDDNDDEEDETFTVSLNSAVNATLDDREGRATIADNDGDDHSPQPNLPELNIGDVTVGEDGGTAAFRVALSGQSTAAVTVEFATADESAEADSDYTARSGTLVFQSGEQDKTITVPVLDDNDDEGDETFTVSLTGPVNATLGDRVGRATITDNDRDDTQSPPGLPKLAINNVTVTEGAGSAVFSVRLSGEASAAVTLAYATADGTATAVADYTARSGRLTFLSGDTMQTLTVPVVDDDEEEANETFTVRLSDVRNATLLDGEGRGTITDNDGVPPSDLPTLSIDDVTVTEDVGSAVFSVRLNGESTAAVTVAYTTADGTATAGADYTAGIGLLTFLRGATVRMLAVPVIDDSLEEANETFTVRLREVRNATLLDGEGRATIVDDDDAGDGTPPPSGAPALSIDDVTLAEDEGSAVFRLSLSDPSTAAVTVAYTTADGTATAGSDYTAGAGTLTFRPGATERTLAVPVLDDSEEEESETFTVRLSDIRNATLADGEGTATIRDDDLLQVTVSFGSASYAVQEGASVAVEVVLSAAPGRTVTIPLTQVPGAGTGRNDYSGVPASLRFGSSETRKSFDLSAEVDAEHDDGESVTLGFGSLPPGVTTQVPERSVVTIGDAPTAMGRVPTDWLREFGRTAASQVVDALD